MPLHRIKRAWNWAESEGHITLNQLRPMKRPRKLRREEIPDDREMARFVASANPAFRELLTFLGLTGCRPGEAAMMEKRHVDLENREVRFKIGEDKTSGKTDRPRVIHLCDEAYEIVSKLAATHDTEPLFKNTKGNRWTKDAMHCATLQSSRRLHIEGNLAVTYAMRHQYITTALARLPALSSAGASLASPCSVSTSRSSNRTGGFPASGSRTRLTHTLRTRRAVAVSLAGDQPQLFVQVPVGNRVFPGPRHLVLGLQPLDGADTARGCPRSGRLCWTVPSRK